MFPSMFLSLDTAALAADPPPPPDASVVDATRLVSLSTLEVMGLGGAGIGFATGANGMFFQPAAPANRRVENVSALTATFAFNQNRLAPDDASDLGNVGAPGGGGAVMTNLGVTAGWRNAGIGVAASLMEYEGRAGRMVVSEGHLGGGAGFWDGRIAVGAGWRTLSFSATLDQATAAYSGSSFETGIALNRIWPGWNVGAVLRGPVRAERTGGRLDLGVEAVAVPWQLAVGIGWYTPRETMPRPVRIAADVVFNGPVEDGVSLESILDGAPRTRGATLSVSPHVGVEATLLPERIRARVGAYLEPARVAGSDLRPHGTAGVEVRLFRFDILGIEGDVSWEAALDVAPRYFDAGWLGFGFWKRGVTGTGWHKPLATATPSPG